MVTKLFYTRVDIGKSRTGTKKAAETDFWPLNPYPCRKGAVHGPPARPSFIDPWLLEAMWVQKSARRGPPTDFHDISGAREIVRLQGKTIILYI